MSLDLALNRGIIMVYDDPTITDSIGIAVSVKKCVYGVVSSVYKGCLTTAALDAVLYKIENRIEVNRNRGDVLDGVYYIINESDVVFYIKEY